MSEEKVRMLIRGAHPDDCQVARGGTLAKWTALGYTVWMASVTDGGTGHHHVGGAFDEKARERFLGGL